MNLTPLETVESKIYLIRGHKVMLDRDLAALYGVPTRVLNQAVRRKRNRFPDDFMFTLTNKEETALRSQIVISNMGRGGRRYLPMVFTEQGVAMLSSVLNSERAIEVNIVIMRVFARLKELLIHRNDLAEKMKELEDRVGAHDVQIVAIFDAINRLVNPRKRRKSIGFRPESIRETGHNL